MNITREDLESVRDALGIALEHDSYMTARDGAIIDQALAKIDAILAATKGTRG